MRQMLIDVYQPPIEKICKTSLVASETVKYSQELLILCRLFGEEAIWQEEMEEGFYFIFAKRSYIVGADTNKAGFTLKTSAELNAFGNV